MKEKNFKNKEIQNYVNEFEQITFARILITKSILEKADIYLNDAVNLLLKLRANAEIGNRVKSIIEIELLLTRAFLLSSNNEAITHLKRAIQLAETENYLRLFLDEDNSILELIQHLTKSDKEISSSFVNRILTSSKMNSQLVKTKIGLLDNLSERELEVLQLINSGLSNKKITEELFISMSTVKTHLRNIYSKLGVHSRTEAIVKAKELNLI